MKKNIFIAGHKGMVGSALLRRFHNDSCNIIVADRKKLDLSHQEAVKKFFSKNNIDQVYIAAAKVGGIHANDVYPADFIYQNLMIQMNLIHSAYNANVDKLLFLGSSCIYPKFSDQPISEKMLLTGKLEETNEPYAVAKIDKYIKIVLCHSY